MKIINAIIERAKDGTYSVYCKDEFFSGAGDSIEDAIQDMKAQMNFYKETAIKEGFKYPTFLNSEYEIEYSVDPLSLLKYYVGSGILSLAGMERISGINQKQLWAYMHGTKPRKAQANRLNAGFKNLRDDLNSIFA
ncbi:MAG: type II toxin-antitoxin system HicB family antitoxin [Bacteroidales bacterium]|nr:type II toxin-antitoxin system HicB family antitoxin [Bacteroidales bacterium]